MRTDRQTDRHADRNTLPTYRGRSDDDSDLVVVMGGTRSANYSLVRLVRISRNAGSLTRRLKMSACVTTPLTVDETGIIFITCHSLSTDCRLVLSKPSLAGLEPFKFRQSLKQFLLLP